MTAALLGPTISKTDALYRPAHDPARSCGTCRMFDAVERRCALVRGRIKPNDTCDYWRAQRALESTRSSLASASNALGIA